MVMGDTAVCRAPAQADLHSPKAKTVYRAHICILLLMFLDLSPKYNPYVSFCEQLKMFNFSVTEFNRL